jgi:hypothetical protein
MSVDRCVIKMWYILAMANYSALKNKEILPCSIAWMGMEDTV